MLERLLRHLRNWFVIPGGIHPGTYTIKGGSIELPLLHDGQYFRITGSVLNDGLHQAPAHGLRDETFNGSVWALAVPNEIVILSKEIEAWNKENSGPYTSESFGGYSYTKATNTKTGQVATWEDAFRSRLNPWRKI